MSQPEAPVERSVVAVVPDLMDRSRLGGADSTTVRFVAPGQLATADLTSVDLVVVDLARPGALGLAAVARAAERGESGEPPLRVVGFGPHVDGSLLAEAMALGYDLVLPRSRFFARWPNPFGPDARPESG